ncbi:putative amino-acid permease [Hyphodiscus hymeniophilus]|uniref:Amino-acid permease n=1 Tax=Hyphodiscus hymeniophilus TaxID=353542 RepID=A0A9P6VPI9_9HELO|nr:putative amino-acid permease [Hyphodiscus hymeniophilus]
MAPDQSPQKHIIDEATLHVTSIFQKTGEHAVTDHTADADEEVLGALGYKQEFKRSVDRGFVRPSTTDRASDFTWIESFAVSFSVLGLLPSVASTLGYNLGYSGQAGSVWGWIVAAVMIQSVVFGMAELCSSMPTAGGLYYASAVLAPDGWGPFASWCVGWSNFLGFSTGPCSVNYALAAMILAAAEISNPDYVPQTWHLYLVFLFLLVIQGLLAMNATKILGYINIVGTIANLAVLVIFLIWLPAGSINRPRSRFNDNHTVWVDIQNGTEWPTGWAFIMGFLTVIWTMSGYDTPFHLSEECSNANIAGPRAIIMTGQLGMYLGFAIILVIAYTVRDVTDVVAGAYGQPMASLCVQVLGKNPGLAMFALNIVAQFFVGQGCTIASSRVVFAYSRDGAIPGSRWWSKVNARTRTPVNSVWFVLAIGALLGLLMFASPVAIGAVFSIGAIAQYIAFTTPLALKLFFAGDKFKPGPWNLGRWSSPVGAVAVAWLLVIVPALCFPAVKGKDLNDLTMNYTCLIYGGTMLFALLYYALSARKWFKGPRVNVEHLIYTDAVESAGSVSDNVDRVPEKV